MKKIILFSLILSLSSCAVFLDKKALVKNELAENSKPVKISFRYKQTKLFNKRTDEINHSKALEKSLNTSKKQLIIWKENKYLTKMKSWLEENKEIKQATPVNKIPKVGRFIEINEFNDFRDEEVGIKDISIQILWVGGFIFTNGIIPYFRDNKIKTEINYYLDGAKVTSLKLEESYREYFQLFLFPITPFYWPASEIETLRKNMLRRGLKQVLN